MYIIDFTSLIRNRLLWFFAVSKQLATSNPGESGLATTTTITPTPSYTSLVATTITTSNTSTTTITTTTTTTATATAATTTTLRTWPRIVWNCATASICATCQTRCCSASLIWFRSGTGALPYRWREDVFVVSEMAISSCHGLERHCQ